MIKLIASDLDNTALLAGSLSDGNRQAIERAIASGVEFVVATGRGLSGVPSIFYEIEGFRYAITSNGSCIYDIRTGVRLRHEVITCAEARKLLRIGESFGVKYEIFVDGKAYVDQAYHDDPVRFGQLPSLVPYIKATRTPVCNIVNFIKSHIGDIENFVFVASSPNIHAQISSMVRSTCPSNLIVDNEPQWVEVMSSNSGKGKALVELASYLSIQISDTCAVGDNDNDIDMLIASGLAIAMGNGSSGALSAADYVTLDVEEDGLAHAIDYVLSR